MVNRTSDSVVHGRSSKPDFHGVSPQQEPEQAHASTNDEINHDSSSSIDDSSSSIDATVEEGSLHARVHSSLKRAWVMTPSESVYDSGILQLCLASSGRHSRSGFWKTLTMVTLLLFNIVMQGGVLHRVHILVFSVREGREEDVFGWSGDGNCHVRQASDFGGIAHGQLGTDGDNWDCGPPWPLFMSNVSHLDTNRDGFWSSEDNFTGVQEEYNTRFDTEGNLTRIFWDMMEDVRHLQFEMQLAASLDESSSQEATLNFTKIPMQWMKAQEPFIIMCNNPDQSMCGNMEVRGILKRLLPAINHSNHRIRKCRNTMKFCGRVFGEEFINYGAVISTTCGKRSGIWDGRASVTVHRYEQAERYEDLICGLHYASFLLLVLVIWGLTILAEIRESCNALMTTLYLPGGRTTVDRTKHKITIRSMSACVKLSILLLIMLPRIVICFFLAYVGTDFLVVSDNYSDLILNCVALGFLIEIDEAIFSGLATEAEKRDLEKLENIEADIAHRHHLAECHLNHSTFFYIIGVVLFAVSIGGYSYFHHFGKRDLMLGYQCLCHAEGDHCVASQLFGGLEYITRDFLIGHSSFVGHRSQAAQDA